MSLFLLNTFWFSVVDFMITCLVPQVQLKYQPKGRPKSTSSEDDSPKASSPVETSSRGSIFITIDPIPDSLCSLQYAISSCAGRVAGTWLSDQLFQEPSLVLVLKWGGELTSTGRYQVAQSTYICKYVLGLWFIPMF
jgi:hypothetical protein